jgi:tetratricopeptide (TPR) repeat protein
VKTCYLSTPFGIKDDALGRQVDFDAVYRLLLFPCLQKIGFEVSRTHDLESSVILQHSIFEAILRSDLMLADVTGNRPGVMYELGIRHALRRNATIVVMARGAVIPFDFQLMRIIQYELADDGKPRQEQIPRFHERLESALRERLTGATSDSPLFDFFPDIHVELPSYLVADTTKPRQRRTLRPSGEPDSLINSSPTEQARQAEQAIRSAGSQDALDYIDLIKRYRDASAWDDLIRAADNLPPEAARAPDMIQMLALALNRRGKAGDRETALTLIRELIDETGGDAESYGILGRIYKDDYERHRQRGNQTAALNSLDAAIAAYQKGFEVEPSNYYPGVNAVSLLLLRGDEQARRQAEALVPRVREALRLQTADGPDDYWGLAAELELAVAGRDWADAERIVEKMAATSKAFWQLESTAQQLRKLAESSVGEGGQIENLAARLESHGA